MSVFPPKDFIIIDSILIFLNFVVPIVFLGLDSAIARYYNDYLRSNNIKILISTSFNAGLISSLLVTFTCLISINQIEEYYLNSSRTTSILILSFITIPFIYINSFCANIFKYAFRRIAFIVVALGGPILFTISIIIAIKFYTMDLFNYFLINCIINIVTAIFALYLIKNHLQFTIKRNVFVDLYKYGIPFAGVSILGVAISFTERTLLNNYFTATAAGIYAFSYRIVGFINMLNKAFQLSWGPFSMANYKKENISHHFNKLLLFLTIIMSIISLIITLFNGTIINLLSNNDYMNAKNILPFLLLSNTFLILSSVTNIGINITKKTNLHLMNYGLTLISVILIFFILVNFTKEISLALTMSLSYMILFVTQSLSSNYYYKKIVFKWFKSLLIVFVTLLIMIYLVFA